MVSHKHKCIFVHIPKTAGVSIYEALGVDEKFPRHHKRLNDPGPGDMWRPWRDYNIIDTITKNYFKFCFVRNPWDRLLSAYCYLRVGGRGGAGDMRDAVILSQFHDFREFIVNFDKIENDFSDKHFYEQAFWVDDRIDFIGKTENIQEDFNTICDKIGIPHQQLPHKNKSKHKHYTEYYDDEAREIVAEKYAKDIEHFGYKFGE